VNIRWRVIAPAALLGVVAVLATGIRAQQQQPAVPDAPTPQAPPTLPGTEGPITPGSGSQEKPSGSKSSSSTNTPPNQPQHTQPPAPASQPAPVQEQTTPPEEGNTAAARFVVQVNFVEVPVTIKDSKGNLVPGLTWQDFTIYENNVRQQLRLFSVDPRPLSIAFVVDQTLPSNVMHEVNESLGAIQGALTPYDEAAVFTYTNGTKEWTGFTGAQGNRLRRLTRLQVWVGAIPVDGDCTG